MEAGLARKMGISTGRHSRNKGRGERAEECVLQTHESLNSTQRTQVESWVQWHRLLILELGRWGLEDP